MLQGLNWLQEWHLYFDQTNFIFIANEPGAVTSKDDLFALMKSRDFIQKYVDLIEGQEIRNIVEFGVFEGGSLILFNSLFKPKKIVGIDLKLPLEHLDGFIKERGLNDSVSVHYSTSQSDNGKVSGILDREFGGEALDLVMDDASHLFEHSRETFINVFPRVREGGWYVIEDWTADYNDGAPLANLVHKIVDMGADHRVLSQIVINANFVAVRKGKAQVTAADLRDRLA
ncbi:class I SAM-dependent methyltransferase [Azospirillum brasilense]|uniref:class I SAM-dependent methyltransferase n=1 Tax=Azospirillum brasilense TaxID=192 RepID=UPI000E0ABE70|nr:class I SAM-dependent methyltransferase [Azospirillum brasilense]